MNIFQIGQRVRVLTEIEVDGFANDDINEPFICILEEGSLVEIAGEPIGAIGLGEGQEYLMIAVKTLDTEGIERVTMVDLEDLAPNNIC